VVRRVVEEDVAAPSTVVTDDGSWIGRTIVTLVILALLVAGAVWLVRALSDNNNGGVNKPTVNVTTDTGSGNGGNDNTNPQPSNVLPS
jgi:hypothetical protein